jgi:DNA-binding GntR family transcriptional regulator
MALLKLKRHPSLSEMICQKLQAEIIDGRIPPSSRITTDKMAKDLNTSRTPVREALMKLEHMGFVSRREIGGWEVTKLHAQNIVNRFEFREMVEAFAILQSATESRVLCVKTAEPILEQMEKAGKRKDYETYRKLDTELHRCFVRMSPNQDLIEFYETVVKYNKWTRNVTIVLPIDLTTSMSIHRKIMEFLKRNDVAEAILALYDHLERYKGKLKEYLERNPVQQGGR